MRLLVLSNFFPPHSLGGMEMTCQEVVDGLHRRGHTLRVLTSRHGVRGEEIQPMVARRMHLEMPFIPRRNSLDFFTRRRKYEEENRRILAEEIQAFDPDLVFIWGMWNLPRSLAAEAEQRMGRRVLYRFGDFWLTLPSQYQAYWQKEGQGGLNRLLKDMLRPLALRRLAQAAEVQLDIPNSYCISHSLLEELREAGFRLPEAEVIHNGIDLAAWLRLPEWSGPAGSLGGLRLLFVGRVIPEKGLYVLAESCARLARTAALPGFSLTIIGDGEQGYIQEIKQLFGQAGLAERVTWLGQLPGERIPPILAQHDILVVPSLWQEPFGRVAIEGMAGGRAVIASRAGALPEIITPGRTGWLFESGNPGDLADQIVPIVNQPDKARQIAMQARQEAVLRFSQEVMLDRVERLLERSAFA
jgi:glycosyltransferase involved in cell wall biosynthesis